MGSATREALAQTRNRLASAAGVSTLATGEQLLAAGRIIGESASLRSAIANPSADSAAKVLVVTRVFGGSVGAEALAVLSDIAEARWSTQDDVLVAIEEIGIRILADSASGSASIEGELASFREAVSSSPELELALGSKLGDTDAKLSLVDRLLAGKASGQTVAIVRHLVAQPRSRRIGELLREAARIVADQGGKAIATVTSAAPITTAQLERLQKGLASLYGRPLSIRQVFDPEVIGGLRIQVGDDVIDGSLSSRINDLRLQLAG
jgi:F-type H+-transporting ATPase subunit delta